MAGDLIFVTGGTGFLGHHLVPMLLANGYRVRLLVRKTSPLAWLPEGPVECIQGDVTDIESVRLGIRGCSYVIHAAGYFRFWGSEETFQRVNVQGTANVTQAAAWAGVEYLVHISTIAVVGAPPPGHIIDEETPCRPRDAYQRTKYTAELHVKSLIETRGLPAVILRPGAFYGPHGKYGFNRLFIEDPMRGIRVQVDRGQRLVFPVFVPDVVWAICRVLEHSGKARGRIYNICDVPVLHAEINHLVSDLLGIRRWRLNPPRRGILAMAGIMEFVARYTRREPFFPLNLRHYVFNDWPVTSARARVELGFQPTPLEEGLRQTVEWYKTRG
ncbi:MAG: NAD-dependent epimerase/dehydratase family protein [Anaerolineales bacterium]